MFRILNGTENARYMEIAKQSVQDLVAKARIKDGPVKWTMLSNECDLKVYKGEGHGTTANSDIHCATMETVGHLDEVMRLYRTDTTEQAKEYVQRFSRALVDTITLYTILPRHPDRPNNCIQIKWFVAKSPFDGLVTKRDFCLLESDLEFEVNGKRAWVRAYKSVDLACVPDLRQTLNLIRGYQYDMGHVFIESDRPGYLDMTYLADMDVKGIVPDWANDQAVIQWCRNLSDIDRFLREDRLSGSPFLRPDQLCPLSMRKRCYLCQKRFGPLRKKSNCAKCGEVLCHKCNKVWQVKVNGTTAMVKCCFPCSLKGSSVAIGVGAGPSKGHLVRNANEGEDVITLHSDPASPQWGAESTFDGSASHCTSDDQSNYSESMAGSYYRQVVPPYYSATPPSSSGSSGMHLNHPRYQQPRTPAWSTSSSSQKVPHSPTRNPIILE
ncbi:hypothetical protein DYB32_008931 [Aphanomyces invadans]|uniref:FYVE-type domain-containing protein n=1 Tax=Aphanomyces invadans TaxID=157072 RepID=A0A3R7A416_9STRA|nr:hypothetical protein DYB32_008931 [Aphanomyces invadans]